MNRTIQATNYIILAMREKWLNLILDGKKTAEVRRTRPARPCVVTWNTGEMTVTICGENAIWKGAKQ